MQIEISKDAEKKIEEAAKSLGVDKKDVIDRALLVYFEDIKMMLELQREMKAWDKAYAEDLAKFERRLWKEEKSG